MPLFAILNVLGLTGFHKGIVPNYIGDVQVEQGKCQSGLCWFDRRKQLLLKRRDSFASYRDGKILPRTRSMRQVVHVDVEELGPHLSPQLIGQKPSIADGCSPQGLNVHRIAGHKIGTHTVKCANS